MNFQPPYIEPSTSPESSRSVTPQPHHGSQHSPPMQFREEPPRLLQPSSMKKRSFAGAVGKDEYETNGSTLPRQCRDFVCSDTVISRGTVRRETVRKKAVTRRTVAKGAIMKMTRTRKAIAEKAAAKRNATNPPAGKGIVAKRTVIKGNVKVATVAKTVAEKKRDWFQQTAQAYKDQGLIFRGKPRSRSLRL